MLTLKNEKINLIIDEASAAIASLTFEGKEYVGAKIPLFTIAHRNEAGDKHLTRADELELASFNVTDDSITLKLGKAELWAEATVTLADNLTWGIEIGGVGGLVTEWVNYPEIAVPYDLKKEGGDSQILWGFNEGTVCEGMKDKNIGFPYIELDYPSQGIMGMFPAIVETQFMAYWDSRSGLYFASHDATTGLKGINFRDNSGGIELEFKHFTGAEFGQDYKLPYPMVMEFFHGDWYDAADIYRSWWQANGSSDFKKITENPKIPDWYGEAPVVITYPVRGHHDMDVMTPNKLFPYVNVLPYVERFEKVLNSKILVLLMHWEGTAPWAPPIVWPPFGGEEKLKELIDALHARGDVFGVYCSGLGWTINSKVAEYNTEKYFNDNNLKAEMCLSPKQTLPYGRIVDCIRDGYDMCPTRDFTKNVVVEQVEKMVNAGIDYVQLMDQNHGGTSYFCYSRAHNHPPVPGKWQIDAVKELLSKANEKTGKVLLGCESAAAETYIPNLLFSDNRFNLAYSIGYPVPAYSYIFHEYLNNFLGNQVSTDWWVDAARSPESFYERLAYSFCAGDMPTLVIKDNGKIDWNWGKFDKKKAEPEQEPIEEFVKNLNFWRRGETKKYLHTGAMVKPISIECGEYVMHRRDGRSDLSLPTVHTTAYKAADGSYGQFLATYLDTPMTAKINLPDDRYVLRYRNGDAVKLSKGENVITVPARDALLIEKA